MEEKKRNEKIVELIRNTLLFTPGGIEKTANVIYFALENAGMKMEIPEPEHWWICPKHMCQHWEGSRLCAHVRDSTASACNLSREPSCPSPIKVVRADD